MDLDMGGERILFAGDVEDRGAGSVSVVTALPPRR